MIDNCGRATHNVDPAQTPRSDLGELFAQACLSAHSECIPCHSSHLSKKIFHTFHYEINRLVYYHQKHRDRMIRRRLEHHIVHHTSEKELKDALGTFDCYNVPDQGEKKRAVYKLKNYWEIKKGNMDHSEQNDIFEHIGTTKAQIRLRGRAV